MKDDRRIHKMKLRIQLRIKALQVQLHINLEYTLKYRILIKATIELRKFLEILIFLLYSQNDNLIDKLRMQFRT